MSVFYKGNKKLKFLCRYETIIHEILWLLNNVSNLNYVCKSFKKALDFFLHCLELIKMKGNLIKEVIYKVLSCKDHMKVYLIFPP